MNNIDVPVKVERRPSLPIKSINYINKPITCFVESSSSIKSATFSDFKEIMEESGNTILLNHSSKSRYHDEGNPTVKFTIPSFVDLSTDNDSVKSVSNAETNFEE